MKLTFISKLMDIIFSTASIERVIYPSSVISGTTYLLFINNVILFVQFGLLIFKVNGDSRFTEIFKLLLSGTLDSIFKVALELFKVVFKVDDINWLTKIVSFVFA